MKIFEKVSFFIFFIIPHVQTLQVASRNSLCAARGRRKRIPENHKNQVFDGFLVIFAIKNVADDLLIRPHLTLRSGFEARPTSNEPSSELKWSYEDFRSTLINH